MSIIEKIISETRIVLSSCDFDFRAEDFLMKMLLYGMGLAGACALVLINYSSQVAVAAAAIAFFGFEISVYAVLLVTVNKRVAIIEDSLPDFLSIMSSNIRSGLTYDRAFLLSAKKEFGPLAKEVDRAAKETIAGMPLTEAMLGMTTRIRSEAFSKTVRLIVEGVNSGGNLAELLENTALDIRRFGAIRKEVTATVLVYQLFMFAAAAGGAPLLYSVSTSLIKLISTMRGKITGNLPEAASATLPFFRGAAVSPDLVFWFALAATIITAFFGAIAAGVISKGRESDGFAYVPVIMGAALAIFFGSKLILETVLKNVFLA